MGHAPSDPRPRLVGRARLTLHQPRQWSRNKPQGHVTDDVVVSERPAEAAEGAMVGHYSRHRCSSGRGGRRRFRVSASCRVLVRLRQAGARQRVVGSVGVVTTID
jgi:hypothetical protein